MVGDCKASLASYCQISTIGNLMATQTDQSQLVQADSADLRREGAVSVVNTCRH